MKTNCGAPSEIIDAMLAISHHYKESKTLWVEVEVIAGCLSVSDKNKFFPSSLLHLSDKEADALGNKYNKSLNISPRSESDTFI